MSRVRHAVRHVVATGTVRSPAKKRGTRKKRGVNMENVNGETTAVSVQAPSKLEKKKLVSIKVVRNEKGTFVKYSRSAALNKAFANLKLSSVTIGGTTLKCYMISSASGHVIAPEVQHFFNEMSGANKIESGAFYNVIEPGAGFNYGLMRVIDDCEVPIEPSSTAKLKEWVTNFQRLHVALWREYMRPVTVKVEVSTYELQ
jgi:hypothetical protein